MVDVDVEDVAFAAFAAERPAFLAWGGCRHCGR